MTIQEELKRTKDKLPHIKRIFIKQAWMFFQLKEATQKQDMEEGFDMVLSFGSAKIPVRIRHDDCNYRDFTIRSKTKHNAKTELDKIKDGAGDLYFYAWTNEKDQISEYMIVNLHKLRASDIFKKNASHIPNGDGTCFIAIGILELIKSGSLMIYEKLK